MAEEHDIAEFLVGSRHVAFSTWLPNEKRLELSGEFCARFGFDPSELRNEAHHKLAAIVHQDDLEEARDKLVPIFRKGINEFQLETRLRDAHGSWRSIFTFGRIVERDMVGYPSRIVCHHVDITDHKSYERYKSLVNNAPMGVVVTLAANPEEVLYTNDHLARILGAITISGEVDGHAYRKKSLGAFMDAEDVQRVRRFAEIWPSTEWNRVERLVPRLKSKTGADVDSHITMCRGQWEQQDAWFFYVLDVTDIHRREFELKRKNEELDAFAYTISHDLRSPIVTIRNFLEYLEPDVKVHPKDRFREDFQRVSKAAAKLDTLLQGILELSRVGRIDANTEEIALRPELERIKDSLAADIATSGVMVQIEKSLPTIWANRTRISQLFQNLVQNSIRHRNTDISNPYVRIGLMTTEGFERVFFVRDNGIGIDSVSREKVFNIFTKLRKDDEGSGIGLAIVRRIVEIYGGRIWIESNKLDGHGVEFHFTLPLAFNRTS